MINSVAATCSVPGHIPWRNPPSVSKETNARMDNSNSDDLTDASCTPTSLMSLCKSKQCGVGAELRSSPVRGGAWNTAHACHSTLPSHLREGSRPQSQHKRSSGTGLLHRGRQAQKDAVSHLSPRQGLPGSCWEWSFCAYSQLLGTVLTSTFHNSISGSS